MAPIDGKKFSKIIKSYGFESELLDEVLYYIYKNCVVKETISFGRCLVEISDLAKRRIMPCKQTRYFELVFSFWRASDSKPTTTYTYIQIDFEAAEELALDEYERRKETLPLDEVVRQAKEIINPIYRT